MKTQPVCGSPGSVLITAAGASVAWTLPCSPGTEPAGGSPPGWRGPGAGPQHRWGSFPLLPLPAGSGLSQVVSAPL